MRASELISEARDLLSDAAGDFWSEKKLLRHLNRALRDVSSRARTLREVVYRQVNAGQGVYALPVAFLGNDRVAWFSSGVWYPLHRRRLSDVESLNHSSSSSRPFYYDIWGRARAEKIVAPVVAVQSGGAPSYNQTFRFAAGLLGAGDVKVNDMLFNLSDGSEGRVTEVTGMQGSAGGDLVFRTLGFDGGTRPELRVGDFVRVVSPNASAHALRVAPPPSSDSAAGAEVLWVYLSRRHYLLEETHLDTGNDGLELDVELETVALECFMYWARREELGAVDRETLAQKQLYEDAYFKALPDIRQRNRMHESTWGAPTPGAGYRHEHLGLEGISDAVGHVLNQVEV